MRKTLSLVSLLFTVTFARTGPGVTWYVDGSVFRSGDGTSWKTALKTIQEGIDKASDGHSVIVAPQTKWSYVENIHFDGRNIILSNTAPLSHTAVSSTIIDGNQAGPVVTFSGAETTACVLRGFTMRNGEAYFGGGLSGRGTHATIENNIITGNAATATYGGGIHMCDGLIRSNTITENSAAYYGGGLYHCNGTIQDNIITDNSALEGGGLASCDGMIEGNTITGNSVYANGGAALGAGLWHCGGVIRNNIIAENVSDSYGGGLACCEGLISYNMICDNGAVLGGGVYDCAGTIRKNVVCENFASNGGGLVQCDGVIESNTITGNWALPSWPVGIGGGLHTCNAAIRNCIIWGNSGREDAQLHDCAEPRYCCIQDWVLGGEGNVDEEPEFVDRDGPDNDPKTYADNDYRLSSDSACIDRGTTEDWMWDAVDLGENPRVFFGVSSISVDMGAYEYNSFHFRVLELGGEDDGVRITWRSRPGDT